MDPGDLEFSPFHAGERAVQARTGVRERIERGGRRMIRDHLPEEFGEFLEALPFLVVGSLDPSGRPWASLLAGEPGFVGAPTARALIVGAVPELPDPLHENLRSGAPLGVLGIDLETRGRIRVNGRVSWVGARAFELQVDQAFGNCRKYIQSRTRGEPGAKAPALPAPERGKGELPTRALALLEQCDTAFVASASAGAARGGREGVDVSHRGGRPGFVRARPHAGPQETTTRLTLPDYRGNFMFNTLGNIEVNPRAGLLACDFASGDLLSLSGSARVIWDGPEVRAIDGAERLVEIDVERWLLLPAAALHVWSPPEIAPELVRAARGSL